MQELHDYDPHRGQLYFYIDNHAGHLWCTNVHSRYTMTKPIFKRAQLGDHLMVNMSRLCNVCSLAIDRARNASYHNDAMFATLDTLDEWSELPLWRKIVTHDGYAFDVLFMIKLCTDQLNTSKSFNPYPRFPNNPFTREPFANADFQALLDRITLNNIKVAEALVVFLNNRRLWALATQSETQWMNACIDCFEESLRYVRQYAGLERTNELQALCYWLPAESQVAPTEIAMNKYLRTMSYTVLYRMVVGHAYTHLSHSYYFGEKQVTHMAKHLLRPSIQ